MVQWSRSQIGISLLDRAVGWRDGERPTLAELAARIRLLPDVETPVPAATLVREERDAR